MRFIEILYKYLNKMYYTRIYVKLQISMAVCSILYQLAIRPEEQEKIHQELLQILPDPSVSLTTSHLDQAIYMKAFIREVFR